MTGLGGWRWWRQECFLDVTVLTGRQSGGNVFLDVATLQCLEAPLPLPSCNSCHCHLGVEAMATATVKKQWCKWCQTAIEPGFPLNCWWWQGNTVAGVSLLLLLAPSDASVAIASLLSLSPSLSQWFQRLSPQVPGGGGGGTAFLDVAHCALWRWWRLCFLGFGVSFWE